ncbi:MAG: FMN-binding protein [bacterium]|nr:FMN-binding protein [bacterium]
MNPKLKHSLRLVASLAVAGMCSGFILVGVYTVTLPTIQRNRAEAIQKAIFNVVPGTASTGALRIQNGGLVPFEGNIGAAEERLVYTGLAEDGTLVGFAIPGAGPGFMDTISLLYGFDPDERVITGMEVLESKETPGLGDKILKDEDFLANFEALAVEGGIKGVKKGAKVNPNEVDCITGATISSKAVISILNRSNEETLRLLENVRMPAAEPAAEEPSAAATESQAEGGGQ